MSAAGKFKDHKLAPKAVAGAAEVAIGIKAWRNTDGGKRGKLLVLRLASMQTMHVK